MSRFQVVFIPVKDYILDSKSFLEHSEQKFMTDSVKGHR